MTNRVEKRPLWSFALVASLVLAGCGAATERSATPVTTIPVDSLPAATSAPTTAPNTTSPPTAHEGGGRLVVIQHQTSCCYIEGQVSSLVVRDAAGTTVIEREFHGEELITTVADLRLASGTYRLRSFQRPCSGNCGFLGAPTDKCSGEVEVVAGADRYAVVEFAPAEGCTISVSETPPDGSEDG